MKRTNLMLIVALCAPLAVIAQEDDMYFVPNKSKVAEKVVQKTYYQFEPVHRNEVVVEETETITEEPSTNTRDIDEYNRRGRSYSDTTARERVVKKETVTRKYYLVDDEDIELLHDLRRFRNFIIVDPWYWDRYYACYDPWFYSHIGWHSPFWGPWYDP
ncbi:MAG: hypothetical protein HUK03_07875, partial [Bacteroidaceae bacterium]|nr:hypothetical protein [Bacteroidaceae bacterium]